MEDWKVEDLVTSIQAQLHELDRILTRCAIHKRLGNDSKLKVSSMCDDVKRRFNDLPV